MSVRGLAVFAMVWCCACGQPGSSGSGGTGGGAPGGVSDKPHSMGGNSWTVLVYMVADNDLEPFAIEDLNEMMQVGSAAGFNLVVQVDRAQAYAEDAVGGLPNFTSTKRLVVKRGLLEEVSDLGEVNMADPMTLSAFVTWGVTNYPADRTALVFWDHGGGWTSFGNDFSSQQELNLSQIEQGVKQGLAGAKNAKPFALVGFDACLMATWEVALTLAAHAEYLIASEELEPGHGWDWSVLSVLAQNTATDPVALGRKIIEGFQAQATARKTIDTTTLSVVDLYRLGTLGKAIEAVSATFDGSPEMATAFGRGLEASQKFGDSPNPATASNLVDLGHLVSEIAKATPKVAAVQMQLDSALGSAVVAHAEGVGRKNARGLSIYFPPDVNSYKTSYDALGAPSAWRTFLRSYWGTSVGKPTFTNPQKLAVTGFGANKDLLVEGTLLAGTESTVARTRMLQGIVDSASNSLWVFSEVAAEMRGTTVSGSWDMSVLTLTQGTNQGFAYATLEETPSKLLLTLLFEYRKNPTAAAQNCIRLLTFAPDTAGNVTLTSDAYYVSTGDSFGELNPGTESLLTPIIKTISLATGESALVSGAGAPFVTSTGTGGKPEFVLELDYRTLVSGTQVFGVLTAENARGEGDLVIGLAVVP